MSSYQIHVCKCHDDGVQLDLFNGSTDEYIKIDSTRDDVLAMLYSLLLFFQCGAPSIELEGDIDFLKEKLR